MRATAKVALAAILLTAPVACKDDEASESSESSKEGASAGTGSTSAAGTTGAAAATGTSGASTTIATVPADGPATPKSADAVFKTVYAAPATIQAWALAPDGKHAVVSFDNGKMSSGASLTTALLCSISVSYNETRLANLLTGTDREVDASSARFAPDGSYMVAANGALRVFDLASGDGAAPVDYGPGDMVHALKTVPGAFIGSELAKGRLFKADTAGNRTFFDPADLDDFEQLVFVGLSGDEKKLYFLGLNATATVLHEVVLETGTPRVLANFAPSATVTLQGDDGFLVEELLSETSRKVSLRDLVSGAERVRLSEGEDALGLSSFRLAPGGAFGVAFGPSETGDKLFSGKDATQTPLVGKALEPIFLGSELLFKKTGDQELSARNAAGVVRTLSSGLDVTAFAAPPAADGTTYAVSGVSKATRYQTVRLTSPTLTEARALVLELPVDRTVESVRYGPKGKWLLAEVVSGNPYVELSDPNVVVQNFGRDTCGGLDGLLEVYLVRADGSEAIRVFVSAKETGGSPAQELAFDAAETRLFFLSGSEIKAFDLPL